jgi:general stress protein YciG
MPRGASPKRERQYEHIKQSARKSGRYGGRAEEVAARTVNKLRREKGETKSQRSSSKKSSTGASSSTSRPTKSRATKPRSTGSRGVAKKSSVSRTAGNGPRRRPSGNGRGFAGMSAQRQREIAAQGGRAAHKQGTAHEFSKAEARKAGQKGGEAVSRNRTHMAEIGRRGGER